MTNLQELQADVGQWSVATFPDGTPQARSSHLISEVRELAYEIVALGLYPEGSAKRNAVHARTAEELADCAILILGLAHVLDIDLATAIADKMAVNRTREWAYDPASGFTRHVESSPSG